MPFLGLTKEHFSAYTPDKWSSNVHNLARMKVKDVVQQLCQEACAGLEDELRGLARAASDEVPNIINQKRVDAQWVYWFRDKAERESLQSFLAKTPLNQTALLNIAPQDKHIALALVVREGSVWLGLRVSPGAVVDRRNAQALLAKPWQREQLAGMLHELPAGAVLQVGAAGLTAEGITPDQLAEALAQLEDHALEIGHALPAEDATNLGADLVDYARRWLGALAPVYRFLAWSTDNDHIEAQKQIQEEKSQKRRQVQALKAGDRVRVVGGFFSGKQGVVEGMDTKSQVKVRIGTVTVQVKGEHLTPAT